MRYFIVTDPVRRLLGVVKREYNENDRAQKWIPVRSMPEDERKNTWKISADSVAKINDCPWIHIYTEDVLDALARTTLKLA